MKSFMGLSRIWTVMNLLLIIVLLVASGAAAQDALAPLDVRVTFYESTFNLDDPNDAISFDLLLKNGDIILWSGEHESKGRFRDHCTGASGLFILRD